MKAVKFLLKLPAKGLIGAIALILINLIGGLFGLHIALNIVSAFTAGLLGIPGVALLLFLKYFFA